MVYVGTTNGTKDKVERFNGRCHNVGKGDKVLNSTVAVVSPLIKGYLRIISVAAKRRHRWVHGGIFFATLNGMRNIRWRNWRGQALFERTGLKNERIRERTLAFNDSEVFFCQFIFCRSPVDFYFLRFSSIPFVDCFLPSSNVGVVLYVPCVVEVYVSLYKRRISSIGSRGS